MKIDDPGRAVDQLRARLVRQGAAPAREVATWAAWVTGVEIEGVPGDDFAIRLSYVDVRSQRAESWVLDRVRDFADATDSHDVDELAEMVRIELDERISAAPSS